MKNAKFTVILKNGQPWLEWDQYGVRYLKIWKANTDKPYVKWMGDTWPLNEDMINQLN